MKTIVIFIFLALSLMGCYDVETNSPAFQAEIDSVLFRSEITRARILDDGRLRIQGLNGNENITIIVDKAEEGRYNFGSNRPNNAVYLDEFNSAYETNPFGGGLVVIKDLSNNAVSGTFRFTAYRLGLDTLYAQKGNFYQIPIKNPPEVPEE